MSKVRVKLDKKVFSARVQEGVLDMYVGRDEKGWFADLTTSVGMVSGKNLGDVLRKLADAVDGVTH